MKRGGGTEPRSRRVAGLDFGKSSLKLVTAHLGSSSEVVLEAVERFEHGGRPFEAFAKLYEGHDLSQARVLAATGIFADELRPPVLSGLPEDACLEAALRALPELPLVLNVVSVGARGYAALSRDGQGRVQLASSDKCSSGTGETIVKTAARFGLGVEEADRAALGASDLIPITARCSVFAKSEMTHFGNQGKPADQLFRGYFDSIARYVAALLARIRVPGPVLFVGGPSRLASLRERLAEHVGAELVVPEHALVFEALGACRIAADQLAETGQRELPADASELVRPKQSRFSTHERAARFEERVTLMTAPALDSSRASEPAILGLDLGSTGSKAVLTAVSDGEVLLDEYDRTRGNPVDAAQRLVRAVLGRATPDVRAIGVTGSGREAVATVLRAAFPAFEDRIVVINEIVAHATAAIRCDEDGGRSLSVVEIGGQDAKFIQIVGGQIVESDMNKACSAGTGSFLEEQAVFYGIDDIREFTELSEQATRPPNLGQMCTVFVAEAAAEAHGEGFEIADLFAGFQYSVVANYLNRVMGQRSFGERIFFQGKPASSQALAWTLAAVSGREVVVPPRPGEMGAWGIGLAAIAELGRERLASSPRFELEQLLGAQVVGRGELRCRDARCATLCHIDRTTVEVRGARHTVNSGGACPKFEVSTATRAKLPVEAPSAFDERDRVLAPYREGRPGERVIGVPELGPLVGYLPWAVTFFAELGFGVKVLRSEAGSLGRGEERCYSYDACAPIKVAHGVADADVGLIFLPKILDLPDREGPGGKTCNMEQAAPDMIAQSLAARGRSTGVLAPVLSLRRGLDSGPVLLELVRLGVELGASADRALLAARAAARAQAKSERELLAIGERTLDYAEREGLPVVVVAGSLHVIFDRTVSGGIPQIVRQNGALCLPMDCFPVPDEVDELPRVVWAEWNRALRVALAARARGNVFPLLLSAFGCGPSSFVEQIFDALMHGYPHTALESDGHGGTAGFVTRVQAFLHGVRKYRGTASAVPVEALRLVADVPRTPLREERDSRLLVMPVADRLGGLAAAAYRSLGYDAVCVGPADAASLAMGRRDCSGKECLPYQLIWGSFRKHLEREPRSTGKRTTLVEVSGQGACRNCMFTVKDRLSLERMGLSDRVSVRHFGSEADLTSTYFARFWSATVAWDIARQLSAYVRPATPHPERVERAYASFCDRLEALTEERQPENLGGSLLTRRRWWKRLAGMVSDHARELASLDRHDASLRTVLLTGDIYLRIDDFAGDGIVQKLNQRGMRVVCDPATMLVEYLAHERSAELLGLPTDRLGGALMRRAMKSVRTELYESARAHHGWLPMPDVPGALEAARPIIDRYPIGEAPMTVGTVLASYRDRVCDGVVVISPWGCGPALAAESLLRHQREIPMLFLYGDGTPMDERRLNGLSYRLRRSPPRTSGAMVS